MLMCLSHRCVTSVLTDTLCISKYMMFLVAITYLASIAIAVANRKNLIIDTDLFSDVDDAGALLLAATSPHVNLLAVNVNYPSTFSALAASAILAHYGLDVPIGVRRPLTNDTFFDNRSYEVGEYTSKVAFHFSGGSLPWGHAEEAWDPVALYRKALAEAEDDSVTIASIGFFENLSGLLNSTADQYSDLSGRALVARKVSELVVMGGDYPSGHEFNFWASNASLTAHVINTWEGRMVFIGYSIGENVKSGRQLMVEGPDKDPVRMAYIYYTYYAPRPSWDPLAVLYAMHGPGDLFEFGNEYGYNYVDINGSNRWVWDMKIRNQFFLRLGADEAMAAAELDRLFLQGALLSVSKPPATVTPQRMYISAPVSNSSKSICGEL
ncbi:inosine/uridine-preferring nucleoside hydrolase [Xylaria curta]|nr:inosine/uridine-preferring nucleoside hydrolase [Xylaria curta]